MATRRKRNLNFLPAEPRPEPVIDISAYPVDIGVGELMRLTRERLGHELQTVANQLRIRLSYLEAIEDARFKDLPGTTYAVGFVRSYADYLGLDGADIVRRFREEAARIHGQTKLIFPALTAEGKLPRAAVLLVSAVGLAAVYGVWYYISSRQQSDLPVITDVPDRLVLAPDGNDGGAVDRPAYVPPTTPGPTENLPIDISSPPAGPQTPPAGSASAATPPEPPVGETAPADIAAPESTSPPAVPEGTAPAETASPSDVTGSAAAATTIPPAPAVETGTPAASAAGSEPASSSVAAQPSTAAPADATTTPVPAAEAAPPAAPAAPVAPDVATSEIPAAPSLPAVPTNPDSSQQIAAVPLDSSPPPAETAAGVVLEARMDSWIKVVDAHNKTVMQKVLKAGERYVVPDEPGLTLRTGNAGGLDVIVGGRKAPPLGDVGTVLTKVSLEPGRLLDGTAAD